MNMEKKKKLLTIQGSLYFTFVVPAIILIFILAGALALSSIYIRTQNNVILITIIVFVVVLSFLYVLAMMFAFKGVKAIYKDGLYGITREVLQDIRKGNISDTRYPEDAGIKEFSELNKELDSINVIFENATLISNDLDECHIPLEYISEDDKHFVTLESFKENLKAIIYSSQNYRNGLLEISYDFDRDELNSDENERLVNSIKETFSEFPYFLVMPNEDNSGYFVYLPHINSFGKIRELCEQMQRELSVAKKTYDGLETIFARFSLVCYPHSNISELFSDLRYAKRQGQSINFYFPDRISSLSHSKVMQNSINLNNMLKIMNSLSELKISSRDRKNSLAIIQKNLNYLISYLGMEEAGIIYNDRNISKTTVLVHVSSIEEPTFREGISVDKDFIRVLSDNKDPDNSYYFESRFFGNNKLKVMLDKYGISAGFYYVLSDKDVPQAIIFFFNRTKPLIIDSYIRESLYMFSYRISDFLLLSEKEENFNDTYREINSILMVSDFALYRIEPNSYNIISHSQHFPVLFPNVKVGEKCYKALYGLEEPCAACPLKTAKKMMVELENNKYEVSLTLNDRSSNLKRILVHKVNRDSISTDRFDMDLLINSYPSLAISLRNAYSINSRGYLLVLRIDNSDTLVRELGSEGYLSVLRQLIDQIKHLSKYGGHIYQHDTQSIAILMNDAGQKDVVNLCEQLYELTKRPFAFEENECTFDVTYIPYNYPQAYADAESFLKYVMRHYLAKGYETNKDFIYFPDGDYSRSASRNEFMLAVIDEQFGANTFKVVLQPMVRAGNGAIFGAELFIRLSDEYRGQVFNTEELVRVAAKNGKISLISNALIKYIGELYNQFGLTVFKIFGFTRLTINTDFSYFSDPNFFEDIYELLSTYHFPRGFLGFEITETEIMNNLERFQSVSRKLLSNHVALICDQYTGASLSIEVLKNLGFEEIKIPRNFVGDIEVNEKHLNEIVSIMNVAKQSDINVTLVGVENSAQYILLRDLNKNCALQGFHFFKPLEKNAFIDALRDNNNNRN